MSLKRIVRRSQYFFRDLYQRLRYGKNVVVPSFSTIWVNPLEVKCSCRSHRRRYSGKVVSGDWDKKRIPLEDLPKIAACKQHFLRGKSWQAVGSTQYVLNKINELGEFDGCSDEQDISERFARLDKLYEELSSGVEFKKMKELRPGNFREQGGIVLHVGSDGELLFGGGGCHRLAIAQLLQLTCIPAQIGVVHSEALHTTVMDRIYFSKNHPGQ